MKKKKYLIIGLLIIFIFIFIITLIKYYVDSIETWSYKADLGEHAISEIIPTLDYSSVWKNSDIDLVFNPQNKYNDDEKNKIISVLKQLKCKGINKKQKNNLLGKNYPDDTKNIYCKYLFIPKDGAGMYLYGPNSKYWDEYADKINNEEQRNIYNISLVQNMKTKQYFLTLYYNLNNEKDKKFYTYYLIENDELLHNLI